MNKDLQHIRLRGVRTNNLKNIDIDIPLNQLTTVTGLSGSGKSSLVFDTLYAEGQRRYIESLSTYTRQFLEKMPKPDVDSVENIPPAIALEQKNSIASSRPTVASMSELYDYMRLLFAKVGHVYCYNCGSEIQKENSQTVAQELSQSKSGTRFYVLSVIDDKNLTPKSWTETRKALISTGFQRVLLSFDSNHTNAVEVGELTDLEKLPKKPHKLFLVIDRMALPEKPTQDSRLMDALDQAFQHGMGSAAIAFVEPWKFRFFSDQFQCDNCNITYQVPDPNHFSFNSPIGACSACSGFGFNLELDEDLVVPDQRRTLKNGAIDPLAKPASADWFSQFLKFCEKHKINSGKRYEDLTQNEKKLIWDGDGSTRGFLGIRGCFEELKGWKYKLHVRVFIRRYQTPRICQDCHGARLKKESRYVRIGSGSQQQGLHEILSLSIEEAFAYFEALKLSSHETAIAKDILHQIRGRLKFMNDVGVGYLTLNRLGKTLSGGECQRLNLATQLGNSLCSTLYILDEPSIGLHSADTEKLITLIQRLRDLGNTVVLVEHDLDMIRSSDYVVELGPLAGFKGGEVVSGGPLKRILEDKGCLTAKYLAGTFSIPKRPSSRARTERSIRITGATENNLRDVTVEFPLNLLIAVTGLSGSGKTTLVHRTLHNALAKRFHKENLEVGKYQRIYGAEFIQDIVLLDQTPIGKNARSNPATYLKVWEDVRKIYANQSLSIRRGYGPQHFSFNIDGGRCPVCKGEGEVTLEMHFMSDLRLPCEECDGKKFKKTILEVEYKNKNVFQLLRTTIDECVELFRSYPNIVQKLQLLRKVGLGYLELGQSATTLSGGECQRLKIASSLQTRSDSGVLYIFDEPTTGLHIDDVRKLIEVLHELVDQKNTVIVIEHNLDLIAQADWVIDLGPGGGKHGGQLVVAGPPSEIAACSRSITGQFLGKR